MQVVVQVFARAPVAGACKRRMIPALGAAGAARLHACMVERTVRAAARAGADALELWCTPDPSDPFFRRLADESGAELRAQEGVDLGRRMHGAIVSATGREAGAVLLGCDCPGQDTRRIDEAVSVLRRGVPALLRPARDGGYVCVGLARPAPLLFDGIDWGSSAVLGASRERLRRLGLPWTELPALADVDRPEDLPSLPAAWRRQLSLP